MRKVCHCMTNPSSSRELHMRAIVVAVTLAGTEMPRGGWALLWRRQAGLAARLWKPGVSKRVTLCSASRRWGSVESAWPASSAAGSVVGRTESASDHFGHSDRCHLERLLRVSDFAAAKDRTGSSGAGQVIGTKGSAATHGVRPRLQRRLWIAWQPFLAGR